MRRGGQGNCGICLLLAMLLLGTDTSHAGKPRVRIDTTAGSIVIELEPERAPLTVKNFLAYVEQGFYAGTVFHRVVPGFIVQGGGYTAELTAKQPGPTIFNESGNGLENMRGTVGMARSADPHSAEAQFFFNLADNGASLDPRPTRWGYAVFGRVVEGLNVVEEIGNTITVVRNGLTGVPPKLVVINKASLEPDSPP